MGYFPSGYFPSGYFPSGYWPHGRPPAAPPRRLYTKVAEANETAKGMVKKEGKAFLDLSESKQAKRLGCHLLTWRKTEMYRQIQRKKAALAKQATPRGPRVVGFTPGVEARVADEREKTVQELVAEQQQDFEPAPTDPTPRKVRNHKRV
jgi:hypothetical protein